MKLFSDMSVLSAEECAARQSVMLNQYVGTVEIEVATHSMYVCMYVWPVPSFPVLSLPYDNTALLLHCMAGRQTAWWT